MNLNFAELLTQALNTDTNNKTTCGANDELWKTSLNLILKIEDLTEYATYDFPLEQITSVYKSINLLKNTAEYLESEMKKKRMMGQFDQVLTDLYTVLREKDTIDGLHFLCIGEMRMRTMHSIGYALTNFDCEVSLIAPPEMSPTDEWKKELRSQNLRFREVDHVEKAISDADVIYIEPVVQADYTQSRVERGKKVGTTPSNYKVTRELLLKKGKSDAIILHSLPRMDELPPDVDSTRHARYWEEAFNGVVLRMALLALVLGAVE